MEGGRAVAAAAGGSFNNALLRRERGEDRIGRRRRTFPEILTDARPLGSSLRWIGVGWEEGEEEKKEGKEAHTGSKDRCAR